MKKILIAVLSIAVIFAVCACGDKKAETYKWPDTELGNLLPEIAAEVTDLSSDEDSISATIKIDKDEYKDYMAKCKDNGFTKKEEYSEHEDDCYFTARDESGNQLELNYHKGDNGCGLTLDSYEYMKKMDEEYAKEEEKEKKEEEKAAKEKKAKEKAKKKKSSKSSSNINSDFKKMMDEYEDYMNDYVAFMKKYEKSDDVASMTSDYTDMMAKYEKYMKKIDKVDTDSLSADELAYYNKVTQRVAKKLSEI